MTATYYVDYLHSNYVGTGVLNVSIDDNSLLIYAHCSRLDNGTTFIFVNPSNASVDINVATVAPFTPVYAYIFTAPGGDLNSTQVLLNGEPVSVSPSGIPTTMPATREKMPLTVLPWSVA